MVTDKAIQASIREARAAGKPLKRCAERGMYLQVQPTGSALWRFKYAFEGREKLISLGPYSEVPLAKARELRDQNRKLVRDGVDPSALRKAAKYAQANSVTAVAEEWFEKRTDLDAGTLKTHRSRYALYIKPHIGRRPISAVIPADLLTILRKVEEKPLRGAIKSDTAKKVRQLAGQIWRYAVATQRAQHDISASLKGALTPGVRKNFAALVEPAAVGGLLRAIDGYDGQPTTQAALQLAALLFQRPGELRHMEWSELNLGEGMWRIPAHKMKMKSPHLVPLSTQALRILRGLEDHSGGGKYVFPTSHDPKRPMSENTLNSALRRLGYEGNVHVAHGFRTTASTLLNELGFNRDWIEAQLAHQDGDAIRRAYNKAQFLSERKAMMQSWADHLDVLRSGTNVVAIGKRLSA